MNKLIELILIILLGWIAGIIVNYVSDVLPLKRKLIAPFCKYCESKIPMIDYVLLRQRCLSCGRSRSWRVWVIEIVYVILTIWIWQSPPERLGFWIGLLLLVYFGIVVTIDLEYRLIMHPVSLVGAGIGICVGFITNGILDTLIGGVCGFGIMWLLFMFGKLILGWITKRRGQDTDEVALGFGDVNLVGVLGLMLGWPAILLGLMIAILLGGIVSLIYLIIMVIARRYQLFTALPYGPFLIASAILILFFKENVVSFFAG